MRGWKRAAAYLTAAAIAFGSAGALPEEIFEELNITASADYTSSDIWDISSGRLWAYHGTDTHVVIPENVRTINDEVFMNNTDIVSITFPERVEMIGTRAFAGCTNLSEIVFTKPKTSLYFGTSAFKGCTSLKELTMPAGDYDLFFAPFEGCTGIEKVTFPDGCKKVESDLFKESTSLKEIVMADSVEEIEESAFSGCINLKNIKLSANLRTIGYGAFSGCTSLTDVTMPDTVTLIDEYAFYKCAGLKTQMPASLKKIGKHAFDNCTSLTDIVLPEGFEDIAEYAFGHCTGLTYMNIPSTLIRGNAVLMPCDTESEFYGPFANCDNIHEYDIKNGIAKLDNVLSGCRGVTSVVLPPSVTEICDAEFYDNINLSSVTIPASVSYVGSYAFGQCSMLTSLSFSGLDRIEEYAFTRCSKLSQLDFGDYLVKLDKYSLYNTRCIETLVFPSPLTEIPTGALGNVFALKDVYIPDSVKTISGGEFPAPGASFVVHASKGSAGEAFAQANGLPFEEYNSTIHVPVTAAKNGGKVTLSWSPVSGVEKYKVVAIDEKTYHYTELTSGITGTSYTVDVSDLAHTTTYYVRAYKDGKYWDGDPADGYTEVIPTVTGLDITLPEKTYYYYTEADVTGGTMVVHYDDGTSETVPMNNSMVTGFSQSVSVSDLKYLYITYKEFQTSVEITVTPVNEVSIKVTPPTKVNYYRNESIDVAGGTVTVYYDSGYSNTIPMRESMTGYHEFNTLGKFTVNVSYVGLSDSFEVTVVERPIKSVDFVPPENTSIVEGKQLNTYGGKFILHYQDGTSYDLDLTSDMLSEYDNRTYGEHTVTATYAGYSFDFTITVNETQPHLARLAKYPDCVVYVKGEPFNPSGGKLNVWYDNGVLTYAYMGSDDVKITGYDPMKVGTQTLTATYCGLDVTFDVTVRDDVESVTVTPPTVTEYNFFSDIVTTGGSVTVTFSDGTQSVRQLTRDMISGYDKTKIGTQNVNVAVGNRNATLSVTVKPLDVKSTRILLDKDVFYIGEKIDLTGAEMRITLNSGSTVYIYDEYLTLGEYDNTVTGWRKVKVYCGEYSGDAFISFTEPNISKITLTPPSKLTYFINESLDVSGGSLKVLYENGTSKDVPLTASMVTGFNSNTSGKQTLTVKYGSLTTSFDVNVVNIEVSSIKISKNPTKTQYFTGEALSVSGGEMTVEYNNGTSKVMTLDNAGISGYDKTKTGKQTITVTYQGKTATFSVTVNAPSISGITVTAPTKTTYFTGEDLDLTGGKVTASYNYGEPVTTTLTSAMVSGYDKTKTGKQTITVTYQGMTATFSVTVNAPSVSGITVTAPTKTTYFTGEDLDLTGGKVTASYNYGDPVTTTLTSAMVSGYDKTKTGKQTITVTYQGMTATFSVTVNEPEADVFEIVNGVLKSYNGSDTEVTVPDNVTAIGKEAFKNCKSITKIVLPASVTSIGDSAFYGCTSLQSINLPQNIEAIESKTFYGCSALTGITLPKSMTSFASTALTGCTSLEKIEVQTGNKNFRSRSGVLYSYDLTTIIRCPAAYQADNYWISGTVTTLAERAFQECKYLTKISIPNTVTTISDYVFTDCVNLKSITLPSKLSNIPGYCFIRDTSLETITIPETVTSIGRYTFYMSGLKNIVIPKSVISIEPYAFAYCQSLASVKLPNSVTTVREHAFAYCDSLTEAVIGKGIKTLEEYSFMRDPALKTVYYRGSEEQWNALNFKASVFAETDCTVSFDYNDDFNIVNGVLKSYVGEDTVITIPDTVTSIDGSAFKNCEAVTSITMPESLTRIESYAFAGCKSLTSVTIPKSVTYIGDAPFSGCIALKNIYVQDGNTSFVSKNGVLFTKDMKTLVTYPCSYPDESYTVPSTVTKLTERAFANCQNLVTLVISGQISTITDRTFMSCKNLKNITLPASLRTIEGYSFLGCEALESITIPDGITSIERYTFYGCGLKSITFPSDIDSIGTYAFAYCNRLTSVTIPDTVTTLHDHAFSNCDLLEEVIIGTGVKTIEECAFMMDPALKNVYYKGTEEQWNAIDIKNSVFYETDCTISYNYVPAPVVVTPAVKTVAGNGQVTLTWDTIEGATKYCVAIYENGSYTVLDQKITKTTYTATGLENGKEYKFLVQFYNGKWSSKSTKYLVSATPEGSDFVVTTAAGDGQVTLKWNAMTGATKYAVSIYDNGAYKVLSKTLTGTSYTAKNLTNGMTYRFLVQYYTGKWSSISTDLLVSATPVNGTIPVVKATPGDKQVTLDWNAVTGATKYAVSVYENGAYTVLNKKITGTSYTASKLTNGKEYKFLVQAYTGKWSSTSTDLLISATPVDPIIPAVTVSAGDGKVTLSWNSISGATKYAVSVYENGAYTVLNKKITGTSYTVSKLTNGKEYKFLVQSYTSKWSSTSTAYLVSATPASAVPVVSATSGNGKVTLSWKAIDGSSKYAVSVYENGTYRVLTKTLTGTSYTAKNLENGREYKFLVQSYVGKWSNISTDYLVSATPKA